MATENVRILKIQTSVKELRQQLKDLKDTMLSCEKGTEEYNKALQQAADISHRLKEQTEELNASAMDFGQITGNLVKATGGLVAGLQAAKATMNLFGIENEDVIKSLEKMQNLMALTQALPSIDNGIKAFKRLGLVIKSAAAATGTLGKALMATGIGLAVAAVAALAANWDKVKAALGGVNKEYEEMKQKRIDEYTKTVTDNLKEQVSLEEKLARARGGSDIDAAKAKVAAYTKEIENTNKELEDYQKLYNDWVKARNEANSRGDKNAELRLNKVINETKIYIEQYEALKKNYELEKERAEAELRVAEAVQKATKAKESDEYKKALEMELETAKGILGAEKSLQQRLDDKFAGKPLKVPVELEIKEDEDTSVEDALAAKYKQVIENAKASTITTQTVYDEELSMLNIALENQKISYEEYYAYLKQLQQEKLEGDIAYFSSVASVAQTALSDIGSMFSALADAQNAETKEGFEEQKKYQIAAATMNMLGGVVSAWTSAMNPANAWMTIWGQLAMGAASTAAILATGIIQIQKIKQQQMQSGSTGGSTNTASLGSIIAPVQYTQDVQGAQIEGAIKDTKVYVTETDITNTQNRVSVTESEARY